MPDEDPACILLPMCWLIAQIKRAVTPPPQLGPGTVSPPPSPVSSESSNYISPDEDPDFRAVPPYMVSRVPEHWYIGPNAYD